MVNERRRLWSLGVFLLVVTLARLWAAGAIPLTEDEAYYRLWAQHPALGYFDHPPMIAWWIWLGVRLAGDTAAGVRLLPVLACSLTSLVLFQIARRLTSEPAVPGRALVWHQATLLVSFGGFLATPDSPLTLFWTAGVWLVLEAQAGSPRLWLLAGVAAGLALLSKYSALFLPAGLGLWMLSSLEGRRALRTPWPWAAAAIAIALFALNLDWNADHGWVTFTKQFGRAVAHGLSLRHLPELILVQGVLLNPIITVFAVLGLARLWRLRAAPPANLLAPVLIGLPFAGYLAVHSLHAQVQGHWPAALYPLAALLAAVEAQIPGGWVKRLCRRIAPASLLLAAATFALAASPLRDLPGVADLALSVRGWPDFAARVEAVRKQQGAAWVGTLSYGAVGQLRLTGRIAAPVIQIIERQRYRPDDGPADLINHRPGLIVDLRRRLDARDLARCFGSVAVLDGLDRGDQAGPRARYFTALVSQPRHDIVAQGCWAGKEPDFAEPRPAGGETRGATARALP